MWFRVWMLFIFDMFMISVEKISGMISMKIRLRNRFDVGVVM